MGFRGRGNQRARGFPRPFRARGRGWRPFPHRGKNRGGFGMGDEGLRITLRNTDHGRRSDDHGEDYERDRRDDFESEYRDDFDKSEEGGMFEDESSHRDSTWKRKHADSDSPHTSKWDEGREEENRWEEGRQEEQRWEEGQEEEQEYQDRRHSRDDDHREGSYEGQRGRWQNKKRGRGFFRPRGYDPNYRGRGRGRGDFRGGFRGRGKFDPYERRGRGFYKHFERGRGRGGFSPHDRRSFDSDSHRRSSLSPDRRHSRSRDRFSRSPDRRRSRSFGRSRSRSYSRGRRSYSRSRSPNHGRPSFLRGRSRSRGRRSLSRGRRSLSRGRRSLSQGRRSLSRGRRSLSRGSRRRSHSRGRRRSRSDSYNSSRRSSSRSRSPAPMRGASRPKGMGQEISVLVGGIDHQSMPRSSPPRSRSQGRSLSQGRDLRSRSRRRSHSSSSSSGHGGDSRNQGEVPMTEQQYEEEMYRRLKSEINSQKDPKDREEGIAVHIREMAKLSPVLFRQFMAKNAGNLSAMALMQPEEDHEAVEFMSSQGDDSRPLRSILKRKGDSRSPSPTRNPSPPPQQPKAFSQIEKVIQALRKGGSKPEEPKPEKEETPPPPPASGALRQLYSYMDIDEEEEYLYGDGEKMEAKSESMSGPFWSAHHFEEKHHSDMLDMYGSESLSSTKPGMREESTAGNDIKIPSAFSSLEEKEKSYEQWRASVFQKSAPEKPKESDVPESALPVTDSTEQLSSTVENILKSIGFNFELSQRMQDLARQKKEEEQDSIKIDQSASFLGADPDTMAQSLGGAFEKEEFPPAPVGFMKEIEAAKQASREKAQRVKESEERRIHGSRNRSFEKDHQRMGSFSGRYDDSGYAKEDDLMSGPSNSRKPSDPTRTHSPYNPNVPDYLHRRSVEGGLHSQPSGLSNLVSVTGSEHEKKSHRHEDSDLTKRFSESSLPDFDRHDKEEIEYKRAGERILIVRKKEDKGRVDSPGSENIFSRRIVLPPKEKVKAPPSFDSRKEGKRRLASPDSPKQSKYPRRSPSLEEGTSGRRVFQKSKDRNVEESKGEQYRKMQERTRSPDRRFSESKYKYQAKQGGSSKNTDFKVKPEHLKALEESCLSYSSKTKEKETAKPEPEEVITIKDQVKEATRAAESKASWIERKRQLAVLQRELEILKQQHNELLRKRRRQKDGHKDPLILENSKLQKEIATQITALRLGGGLERPSSPEAAAASSSKDQSSWTDKEESKPKEEAPEIPPKEEPKIHYEYFDPGSHWCSSCNMVCGHMFDFFKHVESKKHQQKLDPFNRPWLVDTMQKEEKKPKPEGQVQAAPIKGLEFMMATSAFYCSLCKEFCGDLSIAESHMKSEEHHNVYKEYLSQHPYYEKRHMLERSAALSSQTRSSSLGDKEDAHNSDNDDKQKSDQSKRTPKSDSSKNKAKKEESWKDKILGKKMYADYEDDSKVKFESREKDNRKYRRRSRERSKERRGSRERRGSSRERKGSAKRDRRDSKEGKGEQSSKDKPEKSEGTKADDKEAAPEESEQKTEERGVQEGTTQDSYISMEMEAATKEEIGEGEKTDVKDEEIKAKIPIKLTGKSGIKPATAAVPPWKMFTRPIPKLTAQKRLLTSRPQAASTSSRGQGPKKEPASLDDFLTVGVKKTVPVVPDTLQIVEQPPDPKTYRKGWEGKAGENKEKMKELKALGIDPSTLVPSVKPKTPPPPSQNLSLPAGKTAAVGTGTASCVLATSSASVSQPIIGAGGPIPAVPAPDFTSPSLGPGVPVPSVSETPPSFCPPQSVSGVSPQFSGPQYGPPGPGFAPPVSGYGPPGSNYGPPGSGYGPPGSGYGPPGSGYGPPGSGYGPPGSNYGPPGSNYGSPGSNYGPPCSNAGLNFGPPGSGYGPPGSGYGPPGSNYGPGYGPPPMVGPPLGPPGPRMGPCGPPMGPCGPPMGPHGPPMRQRGPLLSTPIHAMGLLGSSIGPLGPSVGPCGPPMGPHGPLMGPPGPVMGPPATSSVGPPQIVSAPPKTTTTSSQSTLPPLPPPPPPLPQDPIPIPPPPPSPPKSEPGPEGKNDAGKETEKSPKPGESQTQESEASPASPTEGSSTSPAEGVPPTSQATEVGPSSQASASESQAAPATGQIADTVEASSSRSQLEAPPLTSQLPSTLQGVEPPVGTLPATSQGAEAAPPLQQPTSAPTSQETEVAPTVQMIEVHLPSQVAETMESSPVPVGATAGVEVPGTSRVELPETLPCTVSLSSMPPVQLGASDSAHEDDSEKTTEIPSAASGTEQGGEMVVTNPNLEIQSDVSVGIPGSAVVSAESSADLALSSTSSAAQMAAGYMPPPECVLEAQPSTSLLSELGEFVEPTSTLVPTAPMKKNPTRRSRGGRKAAVVQSAEESGMVESDDSSPAAPCRRGRGRTRSQARQQPQRQTRSRTRQQKTGGEDEESVTASDEVSAQEEVGSSTAQEEEFPEGLKFSASPCVLDLTNPPADSSGPAEASSEVTSSSSSSSDLKSVLEPPSADSALNLTVTVPPEIRGARQGLRVEQTMPEDLSSYALPQDLSTSARKRKGRHPPEMPIDLTKRLVPSQSQSQPPEGSEAMEVLPSPSLPGSSSDSGESGLDPQTMKDTLLSSTFALNPSSSHLVDLDVGDDGDVMEVSGGGQGADSAGLGVDPAGELVDFSLASVNFEELEDMEVEEANSAQPQAGDTTVEDGGSTAADSTFP
ncbi:hypothetical protein ACOMHN_013237 [Nucella lapillus]